MKQLIPTMDWFLRLVIFYSVGMYVAEIEIVNSANSLESPLFWLWSERVVASIFTLELIIRWLCRDYLKTGTGSRINSVKSLMFWVDMIAILPFWIGFFVPVEWLGLIRTLRILRLMKLYRYCKSLRKFIKGLMVAKSKLLGAATVVMIVVLFSMVAIHELEAKAQPESFGSLFDCLWYVMVTLTTVGYGDISPITHGGKIFAQFMMIAGLGVMASFIGIVGGAVLEEMKNDDDV